MLSYYSLCALYTLFYHARILICFNVFSLLQLSNCSSFALPELQPRSLALLSQLPAVRLTLVSSFTGRWVGCAAGRGREAAVRTEWWVTRWPDAIDAHRNWSDPPPGCYGRSGSTCCHSLTADHTFSIFKVQTAGGWFSAPEVSGLRLSLEKGLASPKHWTMGSPTC